MSAIVNQAEAIKDKTKGFFSDFKAFAMKGNVIDLAVAVIIGNAFGKIVHSLVNNIVSPLLGSATSGVDLSTLAVTVGGAKLEYGLFIQAIIDFTIIALCVFIALRFILRRNQAPPPPPAKPADVVVLEEIRDLLKGKQEDPTAPAQT